MNIVFTIITGGYDTLWPIRDKNPDWRYICITDDMTMAGGDWELMPIEALNPPKGLSPVRLQRWAKIIGAIKHFNCPTIYVDANLEIILDITKLWAGNNILKKHPARNCFIEEGEACKRLNKDHAGTIDHQISAYVIDGLSAKGGMYETGVLFRNNDKQTIEFCNNWWHEVSKHSHRDQLSIMKAIECTPFVFDILDWKTFNQYTVKHKHKH